ncbi:MAG: hypothetical protein V4454_09415 [Pseudomonadota bacterium]
MTWPPLTDLFALLGVNLVLCAVFARLLFPGAVVRPCMKWLVAAVFLLLWLPVGSAHIPVVAYIRGLSSDLSLTLVMLAGMGLWQRMRGVALLAAPERTAVFGVVVLAAVLLYPTALGWGDFDAYRLGWGSPAILAGLFVLCVAGWILNFRLLPLLIAVALLAWVAGLMESTNLWDYLMDPWLTATAFVHCLRAGIMKLFNRRKPSPGIAAG